MTANEVRQRIEAAREAIQEYLGGEVTLRVYLHESYRRLRSATEAETMAMGAAAILQSESQHRRAENVSWYNVENNNVTFTIFHTPEEDEAAETEQAPAATEACAVGTA